MSDYRVNLEIYNGPLDLLLYLIRRAEVDITDIPIASITKQYIEYVELLQTIDLEAAGDFLVLAATLMEIKSAMLLPRTEELEEEGESEDLGDPRLNLVRQLLEYKKFKDFAGQLDQSAQLQSLRFARSQSDLLKLQEELKQEREFDIEGIQIWDLFDAFQKLMKATLANKRMHEVIEDDTPIDIYETEILDRAQQETSLTFQSVFQRCRHRLEMVGLFLALLELIRMKLVRIEQEKPFSQIYIYPMTAEPAELAVAHAISADIQKIPSHRQPRHGEEPAAEQHAGTEYSVTPAPDSTASPSDKTDLENQSGLDSDMDLDAGPDPFTDEEEP